MSRTILLLAFLAAICFNVRAGFSGDADAGRLESMQPRVTIIVSEDRYHADETLSVFAKMLQERCDCRCTLARGHGKSDISGLEALKQTDVAVLFVRRQALPKRQLDMIREYLDAGGPLVALRTASHAFSIKTEAPAGSDQWPTFDHDVLGGGYQNHAKKKSSEVMVAPGADDDAILAGVEPSKWTSNSALYFTSPVDKQAKILLLASAEGKTEPAAWTRTYKKSRVFYTSLGAADDFSTPQFSRLLVNAIFWAMDRPVPKSISGKSGAVNPSSPVVDVCRCAAMRGP